MRVFLVTSGQSINVGLEILQAIASLHRHSFLAESISYTVVDCGHVVGHRQVTDAYLIAMAKHHKMVLATFDRALANLYPADTQLVGYER